MAAQADVVWSALKKIEIPEEAKLIAATLTFAYVGTTLGGDIIYAIRHTKYGRRTTRWLYHHPTAARCLLLTGTGALIAAWPATVAKMVSFIAGIGPTKGKEDNILLQQIPPPPPSSPTSSSSWGFKLADYLPTFNRETESGFTSSYRGASTASTTTFVGIIQSAVAGRKPGFPLVRQIGYAVSALSASGAVLALQWRRLRGLFASLRNKLFSKKPGTGASSSTRDSGRKSSSRSKEEKERKDKERESSTHRYNTPSFPSSSSAAAAAAAAAAAQPPPPPPQHSSSRGGPAYGGVTSPPASEFEDRSDAESVYSRKGSKNHRSSKEKKEKKEKDRKHRK
ncbi:hypothetical protein SLS62_000377 [Diatrype stigma]|uniref:Uncharacterized protein n=1 Tax=Diatrype stigma TaxID=117547 RepID=A0AAN9UXH3_9PEZI